MIRITEFLSAFNPSPDEKICFRSFRPKDAPDTPDNFSKKVEFTRNELQERKAQNQLQGLNGTRGIYFVVNSGGDTDDDITRFNAFFVEADKISISDQHRALDQCPLPPSIRVETKKSVHAYWLISGDCDAVQWRKIQKQLIAYFDADPAIKNPSRVMRVPGFQHLTYSAGKPLERKLVECVVFEPERRYSVAQMMEAFPAVEAVKISPTVNRPLPNSNGNGHSKYAVAALNDEASMVAFTGEGGRNSALNKAAFSLGTLEPHGLLNESEIVSELTNAARQTGLPEPEIRQAIKSGLEAGKRNPRQLPEDYSAQESGDKIRNSSGNLQLREYPKSLNTALLRGVVGELVRAIEPHSESDPVALLFQFLIAFGNAIGRHVYFKAEADKHYANLFAVQVGASSKGRKGTGWGQIKARIDSIDQSWTADCIVKGMASGEGLVWAVRDEITRQEPIKEKGKVTGYQEVIADQGISDKRLLSVESEFASILKVAAREGNTLTALLRQAWDEGDLRTLTKTNCAKATGAHISIIGHVTKDELLRYLDNTEVANGFANRILWYCGKRSKMLPEGGNLESVSFENIQQRISKAWAFAQTERELKRDDEAKELWARVYPKLSEGHAGLLGAVTARAEAQVMRMALIYAVLDCSEQIKRTHLESGLLLWEYCERSARYIFGDSLGDPIADVILSSIREAGDIGLSKTQISDLFKRNASAAQINRALNALTESGKIQAVERVTEGAKRPTTFFCSLGYEINEFNEFNPDEVPCYSDSTYEINEINPEQPIKFVNSLISSDSPEKNESDSVRPETLQKFSDDDVEVF